jgi:hypothetical protein
MIWVNMHERLPTAEDGDENGKVFVWHTLQGAMLCTFDRVNTNRFYTHWGRIDAFANGRWIETSERMPTKDDADIHNCVLVHDRHDGHRITGWHQAERDHAITMWQGLPDAPET